MNEETPLSKRPRGRPKNSKNKAAKFRNYNPKKWPPVFTEIVILSASGISNTELAKKFEFTPNHISNILCTDQAEEIRSGLKEKLNQLAKGKIGDRLAVLQEKALSRVEEYMMKDHIFDKTPTEAVDRALKILSGTKVLVDTSIEKNSTQNNTQNNFIFSDPALLKRVEEGLLMGMQIPLHNPNQLIDPTKLNVTNDT